MSAESLFADDEKEMQIAAEEPDAQTETTEDTGEQKEAAEDSAEKPVEPEKDAAEPAKQERVPLAALLDERGKRQHLEQQLRDQQEGYAVLNERLDHIQEAARKPVQVPSKDDDPVGYLEHENRQLQERLKPLEDSQEDQRDYAEHQAAIEDVSTRTQAYEAQFVAEHPDYHESVNFMRDQAAGRYRVMGYNPVQVQELLHRDSLTLAHSALQNGKDPAAVAYEMAALHGYKKQEAAQGDAAAKIENIQKGQANASSLSGAGGEGAVQLTLEALADMDDDDFDKVSDAQWRKLVASG